MEYIYVYRMFGSIFVREDAFIYAIQAAHTATTLLHSMNIIRTMVWRTVPCFYYSAITGSQVDFACTDATRLIFCLEICHSLLFDMLHIANK